MTRKRNRLKSYDYGQNGAYFITICTKNREPLLGKILVGAHSVRPHLSHAGTVAEEAILKIPKIYEAVWVDDFVIMPNHIHLIIMIDCDLYEGGRTLCAPTVPRIVKQFKEYVTKQIGFSPWQKGFHDHIIRDKVTIY